MSEVIVHLADARADRRGWSQYELAYLHRAANVLWAAGLFLEADSGVTDEGEPWFVFCEAESGEVVAHIARIGGTFVVCTPFLNGSLTGRVFSDLAERCLERCPDKRVESFSSRSAPAA